MYKTCYEFKNAGPPSIPIEYMAVNINPMCSLTMNWGEVGAKNFLTFADRAAGFLWSREFGSMTTTKALKMLHSIMTNHSRPLEGVSGHYHTGSHIT